MEDEKTMKKMILNCSEGMNRILERYINILIGIRTGLKNPRT